MARNGTKKNERPKATPEDILKYNEAWSKMMLEIWREKILRLEIIDTQSLYKDMEEQVITAGEDMATIRHKFLQYGIYQDLGVGRGYEKDNGGNLLILDPRYREGRNMGEPRKPREWFSRPYYASVMVLREQMAYMYAEEFCSMITTAIEEANSKRSATLRSQLWGKHGRF